MPITRRELLTGAAGAIAMAASGCATVASTQPPPKFAYVGCYTTERRSGRGKGVGVFSIDPVTLAWTQVQTIAAPDNPSWLELDRTKRFLYSAHGDGAPITAFRVDDATGLLTLLGSQDSKGRNGVRLGVDASSRYVICANYASGNVAVLPIQSDGTLGPVSDLVALPGKPGPHRTQQPSSQPHDVVFDPRNRFFLVPDKGVDATFVFSVDTATGKLVPASPPSVASRSGAGPRHAAFHPSRSFAYVLNELDSTVTTYAFDPERGSLVPRQVLTTLPPSYTGDNTTSEIAITASGRFVYTSNRGHDSLTIFAVDESGTLSHAGWEPTQGRTPRFFAIDPTGTLLYCANMDSDTIVVFRIDAGNGRLAPTGQVIRTGSPSSIVFR